MPDERGCPHPARRVLIVDTDPALSGLIGEWLVQKGFDAVAAGAVELPALGNVAAIVVDLPFPRQGGLDVLKRIASRYPGAPVVALSSTFFAGVESHGAIARALGVAAVLPMPVKRDALMAAIDKFACIDRAAAAR